MREITVEKLVEGDWSKKFLSISEVKTVIDEPAKVYGPDGKLAAVLVRDAISAENISQAWKHLKNYWPSTTNRGTASGVSKVRIRKDGSISKTNIGDEVNSGVVGFYDRYARIPYCRKCAWNQHNPEAFIDLIPLCQEVSQKFGEVWQGKWQVQKDVVDKTHPDFIIPGTVFSTVTVNKNYRTAAHKDPANLKGSISTMLVLHDGSIGGGELIFPEFELAFRFKSGDLVWFENQKMWHGNTPIHKYNASAQRCSMVFYYREKMTECLSHAEELERAKNRQLGTKL